MSKGKPETRPGETGNVKTKDRKMTITIKHNQNSIDPSATYTDEQFEEVIDSLETEYERELKKAFPQVEVEFERSDYCGKAITVSDAELDDQSEIEDNAQRICELVFETGLFWS